MSSKLPESITGYVCRERKYNRRHLRLWAPRRPMTQLPDEYRVTNANPNPPVVQFAIPIGAIVLRHYAAKHHFVDYDSGRPSLDYPKAVEHLSQHIEYEVYVNWPFRPTADCGLILVLYDNFDMKQRRLIEKDEEDVIQMVQEALGLDKSMRPKWYFDCDDPWLPGSDDEDEDGNEEEDEDDSELTA